MKLRVRGNSIRFRLTQGEVERFSATGEVEEQTSFGPLAEQQLYYKLERTSSHGEVQAIYERSTVRVLVPEILANEWTSTERVGFSSEIQVAPEKTLKILVEKDFKCLQPRPDEDESDAYPHPEANGKSQHGEC